MCSEINIQGKILTADDLDFIRALIRHHPDWNRTRLSRHICEQWHWRDAAGRLKDMACRTMLLKLHRRGVLQLPARQAPSINHRRGKSFQPVQHDTSPIHCSLSQLGGVRLCIADSGEQAHLWRTLLHCYHYLGFSTRVGKAIAYLAFDAGNRPVGALLFGAAAWSLACRDTFIGWDAAQRRANLDFIANNMRFLIPPWVRVPHLASHMLSQACRRIPEDWCSKYGHEVVMLETFVQNDRFRGTCYKAANWLRLGNTTGRTRNDVHTNIRVPEKSIFVHPLRRDFRRILTQPEKRSNRP